MRHFDELRPYQSRIATHLYEHDGALCVLRPGGGKTVAALAAIADLLREDEIRHAFVLAPKRVARTVWPDEIADWAFTSELRYAVLDGTPKERAELLEPRQVAQRELTIVGLDIIPWLLESIDQRPLTDPLWDLLVLDEISRLRNPTGVRYKALGKMIQRWRIVWGLSGTLRPNSALDLFAPVRLVTKGALWGRSYYAWRGKHFYPTDWQGYNWAPLPDAEDKLNSEMAPLTLMIPEDEIPKVTPNFVIDKVELPIAARREYDRMQRTLVAKVADDPIIAGSAAIATGKLAQIANGFAYDAAGTIAPVHDVKREWLADLIEEATGPTLLVYEYLADLSLMMALLPDLPVLGGGIADALAESHIKRWNAGELPFLALHPASSGHGLNLQFGGADMAWLCPTWSPELWEQTVARLARPGQTRPVVVRVCVARNTVDELKLDRVYNKMSAQEAFESWLQRWHAR